jgi:hypothetical protein
MAFLVALVLLPLMVIVGFTVTSMGVRSGDVSRSKADARVASYVCEAGAEEALQLLKTDSTYSGAFFSRGTGGLSTAYVVVTNNLRGDRPTAPNGASVPAGHALVHSTARILAQRNAPKSNPNVGVTRETTRLVPLTDIQRFHWKAPAQGGQHLTP